jgi:hypothetical protein
MALPFKVPETMALPFKVPKTEMVNRKAEEV